MSLYVDSSEQLVIEIFVRNINRSKEFYTRLGFDLIRDDDTFIELEWERHKLFLVGGKELDPVAAFTQANVRIMVKNVDYYWKLVQEMGATVKSPISDRSYGIRDFSFVDPDGFGLRFGTWLKNS